MHDLAGRALAPFHVLRRAGGIGRPQPLAFPALARIVNPPVQTLGVITHRIWHAQGDELTVLQSQQSVRSIAGGDWNVVKQMIQILLKNCDTTVVIFKS